MERETNWLLMSEARRMKFWQWIGFQSKKRWYFQKIKCLRGRKGNLQKKKLTKKIFKSFSNIFLINSSFL